MSGPSPGFRSDRALGRAWSVLRDEGLRSFSLKLASELGYRRLLLLERSLAQPIPDHTPRLPVAFDVLPRSAADAYAAFRPHAAGHGIVDRWDAGHLCFVARDGDRIVSACWVAMRNAWTDYLGCGVDLTPGDAYLFDAFTLPAYRGHGIALALCMQQLRHLAQAGRRRAIRATVPENAPAVAMHTRAGFRPAGTIVRLRIGPWQKILRR